MSEQSAPDALSDWFRKIGAALSSEDYEAGIRAIWETKQTVWDDGHAVGIAYQAGNNESWRNPYRRVMFTCRTCGHADYAHTNFVGACIHGQMKPKDGLDCDCGGMK